MSMETTLLIWLSHQTAGADLHASGEDCEARGVHSVTDGKPPRERRKRPFDLVDPSIRETSTRVERTLSPDIKQRLCR